MYFEQFYLGCLAHASYLFGSEGEAVVVDPQRDIEIYLEAAAKQHLQIRHIFETHLHADFVSGHKELAARTDATIYMGDAAGATFPHVAVGDGFELRVGKLRIEVLSTPGHTPESICLVVTDEEKSPTPIRRAHRRHAVHRRRGKARPFAHAYAAATRRLALRFSAHQASRVARHGAGVSRARRGLAVRTQHARRALVHHRHGTTDQLRPADQEPRRVCSTVDDQPARSSGLFSGRRCHQPRWSRVTHRSTGTRSDLRDRTEEHAGARRDRARRPTCRAVRRGACSRLHQHCALRSVCFLGRSRSRYQGDPDTHRRNCRSRSARRACVWRGLGSRTCRVISTAV